MTEAAEVKGGDEAKQEEDNELAEYELDKYDEQEEGQPCLSVLYFLFTLLVQLSLTGLLGLVHTGVR